MTHRRLYEQPELREITGWAMHPGGLPLTDRLLACGGLSAGDRVLDVGCGCGATVRHLRAAHGLDAVGVDRSAVLLAEGRQAHPGLPIMCADAALLPCDDRTFDAVFCECVLSLLADVERALAECRRVLKDAGLLLVSDLYARASVAPAALVGSSHDGCLRGAVPRHSVEQRMRGAGFSILAWEDHTRMLNELAAQIVFRHGSMLSFWQKMLNSRDASGLCTAASAARPGCYLLVARKEAS